DDTLLAHLRHREVDRGRRGLDTELRRAGHRAEDAGGLEQFLRGDAADVEARAPKLVLLDQRDVEPCAGAVERRRIPARTAADDDEIEVLGRGTTPSPGSIASTGYSATPPYRRGRAGKCVTRWRPSTRSRGGSRLSDRSGSAR